MKNKKNTKTKISFLKRLKFLFTSELDDISSDIYQIFRKRKRIPEGIRNQVLNKSNSECHYCGGFFLKKELTVDHFVPLEIVQEHKLYNLVCSCQSCNVNKGNINPLSSDPQEIEKWTNFLQFSKNKKLSWGTFVRKLSLLENQLFNKSISTDDFLYEVVLLFESFANPKCFNFTRETNKILKKSYPEILNKISNYGNKHPVIDSSNIKVLIKHLEKEAA